MVFLGEKEIQAGRVQMLEGNAAVKPLLTYVTVHVDEQCMSPSALSVPLPLRTAIRKLQEPLHQNEPLELPDDEASSWTLAAHYGLEHEHPVPRYAKPPRPAEPAAAGESDIADGHECDECQDEGQGEAPELDAV